MLCRSSTRGTQTRHYRSAEDETYSARAAPGLQSSERLPSLLLHETISIAAHRARLDAAMVRPKNESTNSLFPAPRAGAGRRGTRMRNAASGHPAAAPGWRCCAHLRHAPGREATAPSTAPDFKLRHYPILDWVKAHLLPAMIGGSGGHA